MIHFHVINSILINAYSVCSSTSLEMVRESLKNSFWVRNNLRSTLYLQKSRNLQNNPQGFTLLLLGLKSWVGFRGMASDEVMRCVHLAWILFHLKMSFRDSI